MSEQSELLICPICKHELLLNDRVFRCENNHCYDQAKQGYVNLLAIQNKQSKDPGDNKEMVAARRSFLEGGHYNALVERMQALILDLGPAGITLLDACCGEGYYTARMMEKADLEIDSCYGFDVSKSAIKAAAGKYKNIQFFIANVQDIPLEDASVDIIQTVFSPLFSPELERVLKEEGYLLVVSAGPDHLKELALRVYDNYKPHNYDPADQLSTTFQKVIQSRLKYTIGLNSHIQVLSLLKMTPYYWNTVTKKLEEIKKLATLAVTCDFELSLFEKVGSDEEEE